MTRDGDRQPFSLQDGIDPSRFSDRVRSATAALRQGSLVARPPLVFAAGPNDPLYAATVSWARTDRAATGVVNVLPAHHRPDWGMIVTQTCDLVEEGAKPKRPWAHIAPVYRLKCDRGVRRLIERERGFDYLCPVTGLDSDDDGLWVVDLRLLMPVEKSWLVEAAIADGFADQAGRDRLARQLSRLFSRPAYPAPLGDKLLKPLAEFLLQVSDRYDGRDPIAEVGLALGRSRVEPSTAQVFFIVDAQPDDELREALLSWGQAVIEDPPDSINVLLPRIVSLDELSAREYRRLDLIDVSAFSPAEGVDTAAESAPGSTIDLPG